MPLTFPAHQAVVLPIKLRWPNRCDATALCIESVVALAATAGGGPIVFNVTLGAIIGVLVAGCSTRA